jgi:DNA-binding transcriptional MerR regulator
MGDGMTTSERYAIGDLARLAGVSRRTVRYYVHEGLIPSPLGVGRGDHYGPAHLAQILRVKRMQESGLTLDEIRRSLDDRAQTSKFARHAEPSPPERSLWRRLTLAPGVELHVAGNVRLPAPGKLQELVAWCRQHMQLSAIHDEADDV